MDGWMVAAAVAATLASWLFNAVVRLVWRPRAVARRMRAQGVRGPAYTFFHGNLRDVRRLRAAGAGVTLDVDDHDFTPIAQPQFREWIPRYGRVFLYWFGSTPDICVADFAVAKQVLADRTGLFPKHRMNPNLLRLLGEGLVLANGDDWQRHRKVVHPAFNIDKLKVMTYESPIRRCPCRTGVRHGGIRDTAGYGSDTRPADVAPSCALKEFWHCNFVQHDGGITAVLHQLPSHSNLAPS